MIEVIETGLYSSIQDKGRFGYENYGVPISGSMDQFSSSLSNKLLNNKEQDAVMEITMTGPVLKFYNKTVISITGADISPTLNNKPIRMNRAQSIEKGDVLSFGKLKYGIRSYLSVLGGFLTRIVKGQSLKINSIKSLDINSLITQFDYMNHFHNYQIKVFRGPEFDFLSKTQKNEIFKNQFTISNDNNRMAFQLKENFKNKLKPIITSLVQQGTVQLTPSGKIIILMRDNQTCGGYPRILQLTENAINRLSQKHMNNNISFELA